MREGRSRRCGGWGGGIRSHRRRRNRLSLICELGYLLVRIRGRSQRHAVFFVLFFLISFTHRVLLNHRCPGESFYLSLFDIFRQLIRLLKTPCHVQYIFASGSGAGRRFLISTPSPRIIQFNVCGDDSEEK